MVITYIIQITSAATRLCCYCCCLRFLAPRAIVQSRLVVNNNFFLVFFLFSDLLLSSHLSECKRQREKEVVATFYFSLSPLRCSDDVRFVSNSKQTYQEDDGLVFSLPSFSLSLLLHVVTIVFSLPLALSLCIHNYILPIIIAACLHRTERHTCRAQAFEVCEDISNLCASPRDNDNLS